MGERKKMAIEIANKSPKSLLGNLGNLDKKFQAQFSSLIKVLFALINFWYFSTVFLFYLFLFLVTKLKRKFIYSLL